MMVCAEDMRASFRASMGAAEWVLLFHVVVHLEHERI